MKPSGSNGVDRDLMRNAAIEAAARHLDGRLVIDTDVHHLAVIRFLAPYTDEPWRSILSGAPEAQIALGGIGDRGQAGRIRRSTYAGYGAARVGSLEGDPPEPVRALVDAVSRIGVDYSIVFPNDLLDLGLHPVGGFEVAVARAYARWVTERVLPHEPRMMSLLYLPFDDPDASLSLIEEFADRPGVVGFLVTTVRHAHVQDNRYARIYATLQERNMALGFHGSGNWQDAPYPVFDSFLAAHALSFPIYNALHLVNLVLSGVPERFPKLRLVFFEAGAAWLPMLMGRLDTAFLMRPSEAPLLTRRPSEYMREFYYTVQPIEHPERQDQMRVIFDMIGRRQIVFATDFPHWDFDMPSSILDLGFLSEEDKDDILAGNAIRAFGLEGLNLTSKRPYVRGERGD